MTLTKESGHGNTGMLPKAIGKKGIAQKEDVGSGEKYSLGSEKVGPKSETEFEVTVRQEKKPKGVQEE